MRSLWTRIGLGAAAVFVVGMLLVTVVGEARSAASSALSSVFHPTGQRAGRAGTSPDIPFLLEGTPLGTIRKLTVRRRMPGSLPDVDLEVNLSDAASLERLGHCDLVPVHRGEVGVDQGFTCDTQTSGYITLGQATFHPGDLQRPIRIPRRMERELRRGEAFKATAESGGEVQIEARGGNGGVLRVQADSSGAHILVNDALGRALVRLLADSTGASFRVRGKDGRDVVHMEAGQGGFSLTVDTSASP